MFKSIFYCLLRKAYFALLLTGSYVDTVRGIFWTRPKAYQGLAATGVGGVATRTLENLSKIFVEKIIENSNFSLKFQKFRDFSHFQT